jgi:hypothetical protein
MKLPNGDRAFVNMTKLVGYSLSPVHEEGKQKARVFAAALGLGPGDAEWLRSQLLSAARDGDCEFGERDEHGQRYELDFGAAFGGKSARLRSAWIVRPDEDYPRLISCYVLEE